MPNGACEMGIQVKKKVAGVSAPVASPTTPAPAKVEMKSAVATVTKHHSDGSTEESQEVVKEVMSSGPMANVGVSMGMTKALAKFENIKFSVSLFMPCQPTPEEVEATYSECKDWVDSKMTEISEEITDQLGH